ncbi:alkaline phosphatase family protein [Nannocystis pusilla]|uniref:Alkaline phosphatase family protein n=1 Tax=Nannocystis pusilla TaxID=889268 RepID=A0ABS7U4X9_9BACT|nr:alkaline phosphatase family protein [Nannocystis pusilla]MBZ5715504.1 alkaline phosphatase family protein [Nannocystis pusilla]
MTKKYLRAARTRFSRRRALQAIGALVGSTALGCSDDGGQTQTTDSPTTGTDPTTGDASTTTSSSTTDVPTTSGGSEGATGTTSTTGDDSSTSEAESTTTESPVDECAASDLTPEELLAGIEHVVVLVMENRSFDHYFGALKFLEGRTVDGLDGDEWNPSVGLGDVSVFKLDEFQPADPPHEWDECHTQFNLGENNGFVFENEKKNPGFAEQVMGYHVREQIPVLYGLADNFALCDRWFCSVMGPTWPNRYYVHACSSDGGKTNFPSPFIDTLWHACNDAGITSRIYFTDVPWVAGAFPLIPTVWGKLADGVGGFSLDALTNPNNLDRFFADAAAGLLPNFTVIDPGFTSNDDHPDHDIQLGQILIGSIYKALAEGPGWGKTLFIITYDEHGGFYDHVPPPQTVDDEAEFRQMGFRVPSLVIGPHVRRGCTVSTQFEHCSIGATLMRRFGLAPLNERMATANDVSSCINPAYLSDPQPAPPIPLVDVSIDRITARVGRSTSQHELFERLGVTLDEEFRAKTMAATIRLLKHAERLGVARLRP